MSESDWQTTELFETLVKQDLTEFVRDNTNLTNSVLLFPPITDRFRFLIHKCVEATRFDLHSFSIGSGDNRRTVVCDSLLLVRFRDTRHSDESHLREEAQRLAEAVRRRAVRNSELKRKAAQDMERNKKRPSQQVYVPAARRANAGDCGNTNSPSSSKEVDGVKTKSAERGRGRARPSAQIYVPGALRGKNASPSFKFNTVNAKGLDETDCKRQEVCASGSSDQTDNYSNNQVIDCELNEGVAVMNEGTDIGGGDGNEAGALVNEHLEYKLDKDDLEVNGEDSHGPDMQSEPCVPKMSSNESQLNTVTSDHMNVEDEACEKNVELNSETNLMSEDSHGPGMQLEICIPKISSNDSQLNTVTSEHLNVEDEACEKNVELNSETNPMSDIEGTREYAEESVQCANAAIPESSETECKQDDPEVNSEPTVSPYGDSKTTSKKNKKVKTVKASKKSKEPKAESPPSAIPSRPEKVEVTQIPAVQVGEEPAEEDSWDTRFDEDGDCLDEDMMKELERAVGKVKIKKPTIDYLEYSPKDPDLEDEGRYGHLIEIYDFPATFKTADLMNVFKPTVSKDFDVKWVDDTHAIGIFGTILAAQDALLYQHPMLKHRPISQASRATKLKAKHCSDYLLPSKERPTTSAMTAHRLVSASLGISAPVAKEKRAKERQLLKEAKEKKKSDHTAKENAWDGTVSTSEEVCNPNTSLQVSKKKWNGSFGKCAMDDM